MWSRRLIQLYAGLLLYGFSMALMLEASLGLDPWDVFHQGIAERTGWSFGTVVIVVGAVVLLAWIPLRQWPGLGTVSNVILIGLSVDWSLALLPTPDALPVRVLFLASGILLIGAASAAYIGAGFGPGPRDGLMTGLVARTGRSVRLVRTVLEVLGARDRLAAWRLRRHRHGGLRVAHRTDHPRAAASVHGARGARAGRTTARPRACDGLGGVTWPRIDGLRTLELGSPGQLRRELSSLVRTGRKRATAGLLLEYDIEGEALEQVGERLVLVDDDGQHAGVVEITRVDVVPFCGGHLGVR